MFGFFSILQFVTVVLLCIEYAFSAPLPRFSIAYRPSSRPFEGGDHRRLTWAVEGAANQIALMKSTVESAQLQDSGSLQKIRDVFGDRFNLNDIEETVNTLNSGLMQISSWHATFPDHRTLAMGSKSKHAVKIGKEFYNCATTPDWLRIGTLIHEASHLLRETSDNWEWTDESQTALIPASPERDSSEVFKGHWDNDYDQVKDYTDGMFHKNADTWFVFGYYLEYGTFPPHNPHSSPNPSTRFLEFVELDKIDYADPALLTFGPTQWFTVNTNLG